jgi:hypothetical protein
VPLHILFTQISSLTLTNKEIAPECNVKKPISGKIIFLSIIAPLTCICVYVQLLRNECCQSKNFFPCSEVLWTVIITVKLFSVFAISHECLNNILVIWLIYVSWQVDHLMVEMAWVNITKILNSNTCCSTLVSYIHQFFQQVIITMQGMSGTSQC